MSQIFTVKMPDIGEGVVEGEVITWLKKVGEPIAQDEPVVVVMTDKATVELPSPYPGLLVKQYYRVGEVAIKDHPLYDIQTDVEKTPSIEPLERKKSAPKEPLSPKTETGVLAAPPVRQLAKELGLDIHLIPGTGKEGRITKEDLAHYRKPETTMATPIPRFAGDEEAPLLGIKHLMAEKVAESKRVIPHFSYFDQADASRLLVLKGKIGVQAEQEKIHLTYMPFFIKALSLCLKKFPLANSSLEQNTLILHKPHHIGIAMATTLGLVVAVLKNVQKMTLADIIHAYDLLKKKGQEGKLSPSELKESTITITNFGALSGRGVFATPIINYPEAAILGVAKIHKIPVVVNDQIVIRDILNCSWSFDHRIIDGYLAAQISTEFVHLIENPALLN